MSDPSTSKRIKHPRTPHLPWSAKVTDDDKMMSRKTLNGFVGKRVIVTEKMDGENTTLYSDYFHARSIDGRHHPSRDWVKSFWGGIRSDIPTGFRVCGENLFARHSIPYTNLKTYFYGFSVWENDVCLSWDDTLVWFTLLGIVPVPVLYDGIFDEEKIKSLWSAKDAASVEGYVVRQADSFSFLDFKNRVAKFVRPEHVQTDSHWMTSEIVPNLLETSDGPD